MAKKKTQQKSPPKGGLIVQSNVVVEAMSPALRAEFEKFSRMSHLARCSGLQRAWELGGIVKRLADNPDKYGKTVVAGKKLTPVAAVAAAAGGREYSSSYLLGIARFNRQFTREQLTALLDLRKSTGQPLSWMHVQLLSTVDDVAARERLMHQSATEDLSPQQLAAEVDKIKGRTPVDRQAGGRPVRIPATPQGRLSNFAHVGKIMNRNERMIYNSDEHGFVKMVSEMPADKITPEFITSIDDDVKLAVELEDAIQRIRTALQDARRIAENRAAQHAVALANRDATTIDVESEPAKEPPRLDDKTAAANGQGGKKAAKKRGAQEPVGV